MVNLFSLNTSNRRESDASQAGSARHILADMNDSNTPLEPPTMPFAQDRSSSQRSSPVSTDSKKNRPPALPLSLSVNYLPTKFSTGLFTPAGTRRRKGLKGIESIVPKRGGGVEAFKSGESRMPGENDEDYDGVASGWFGGKNAGGKSKLRWNKFKWTLFVANIFLTVYSITAVIFCLLTWFDVWTHADVVRVGNRPELVLSTLAGALGIFTSLLGWAGILLNNRSFLAIYTFLLWICFALLVVPGYVTYRRRTFNLEGKINAQWSRQLGDEGRLRIQNSLQCCGYFSPFVEATVSQTCYARSILPGCKHAYFNFEKVVLDEWYKVAFAIVPIHIAVMISGLLCSNHVTYRFGKGMMPKAYRLSLNSMAVIMDNYASQLAAQYGDDVASEVMSRSRSTLQLDTNVPRTYSSSISHLGANKHVPYDSLRSEAAM
jgi:hypothetical protein